MGIRLDYASTHAHRHRWLWDPQSDRAPDGKHPSARNATPATLLRSTMRRRTAGHVVARPGPSDSGVRPPWSDGWESWELLGRLGDRGGAGRRRTGPKPAAGREQEDRGRIRADVYPECWRSIH